jgi:hypothetical protein
LLSLLRAANNKEYLMVDQEKFLWLFADFRSQWGTGLHIHCEQSKESAGATSKGGLELGAGTVISSLKQTNRPCPAAFVL